MMNVSIDFRILAIGIGSAIAAGLFTAPTGFSQGTLNPAGKPTPLFKTLDQAKPGTPIPSLDPASDLFSEPYRISEPGYYYLTQNIDTDLNGTLIDMDVHGITLDLNGFTLSKTGGTPGSGNAISSNGRDQSVIKNGRIIGAWNYAVEGSGADHAMISGLTVIGTGRGVQISNGGAIEDCLFSGLTRTNSLFDTAIFASNAQISDCIIENGAWIGLRVSASVVKNVTVRDCGDKGFDITSHSTVEGCIAVSNDGDGFDVAAGSVIRGCTSYQNGGVGFDVGDGCSVIDCAASANVSDGFDLENGVLAQGCTASNNDGSGFDVASDSTVDRCMAYNNDAHGFDMSSQSTVRDCTSNENGTGTFAGHGINASQDCRITGNTCTDNTGSGIETTSSRVYIADNVTSLNDRYGIEASGSSTFVRNYAANNTLGEITPTSGARLGPVVSSIGNTGDDHPQMNFAD